MTPILGVLLSNLLQGVAKIPIFVKICNFFTKLVVKKAKMGVFIPTKILALFT